MQSNKSQRSSSSSQLSASASADDNIIDTLGTSTVKVGNANSNDDVYDGKTDDTLDIHLESSSQLLQPQPQPQLQQQQPSAPQTPPPHGRRLQTNTIDSAVFDAYEYSKGSCPDAGQLGVPCAPDNLSSLCNKYDRTTGSFRECLNACKPAFCCIHDAPPDLNFLAPNCNADSNCAQYNYCYIAWWKLHDTIGPALFLRVEQDDDFYDIDAEEIQEDSTGDQFFTQVLLHHFDDINQVIVDGTVDNEFNADRIFLDEEYWVYPVANKVESLGWLNDWSIDWSIVLSIMIVEFDCDSWSS